MSVGLSQYLDNFNPSAFVGSNEFCSPAFCDWLRLSVVSDIDTVVAF